MKRLQGKVAIVTGANRGIGRGVAMSLAAEGADIIVNDRAHPEVSQEVVEAIIQAGAQAMAYQLTWPSVRR